MEAQLANLTALVQTQAGMRPGAAMSNSSLVSDTASAKSSKCKLCTAHLTSVNSRGCNMRTLYKIVK